MFTHFQMVVKQTGAHLAQTDTSLGHVDVMTAVTALPINGCQECTLQTNICTVTILTTEIGEEIPQ